MLGKIVYTTIFYLGSIFAVCGADLPLPKIRMAVKDVLTLNYSNRLSNAQITEIANTVDKQFLHGKWLRKFDFTIAINEISLPFIVFRVADNESPPQRVTPYLPNEIHYQFALIEPKGKIRAISSWGDGEDAPFLRINQYDIRDITGDDTPEAILVYSDLANGFLHTVRILAAKSDGVKESLLYTPQFPVGRPAKLNKEACPGTQFSGSYLNNLKIRTCSDFSVQKISTWWECPKKEVETYSFDCKTLRLFRKSAAFE